MVLHSATIHFHIGAWAVSALLSSCALVLTMSGKFDFTKKILNKFFTDEKATTWVDHMDFGAFIAGVVGSKILFGGCFFEEFSYISAVLV